MIEVTDLSKEFKIRKRNPGFLGSVQSLFVSHYDTLKAVDSINFSIQKGELVGYIGQNGAGKSTTIKMLTGILTPSTGNISINGLDPARDRKQNAFQIGVVFGQRTQLWWDLPVEESFDLLKEIYRIDDKIYKKKMEMFFDLLNIDEFFKQQTRKLSLGQRMKADLAASLIHSPEILFLDEPTIGLDLIVKERVREFIRTINREEKVTIILTTHDVQDIEYLANRIIVLEKGKIAYDGNISNFNKVLGNEAVINVHFGKKVKDLKLPAAYKISEKNSDTSYSIILPENEPLSKLLTELQKKKLPITEIHQQKPDLAVAIKKLYRENGR